MELVRSGRKLFGFLFALALAIGLLPGVSQMAYAYDAAVTEWHVGDSFNLNGKYVCGNDQNPSDSTVLAADQTTTIPKPNYLENPKLWRFADAIAYDAHGDVQNRGLFLTAPSDKTPSDEPTGFKIASGSGTQDDPYFFEPVYPASYPLWVGGTQVTSENLNDVLSGDPNNAGKVSFTPATDKTAAKLTLGGANISTGYVYSESATAGIYYDGDKRLDIELKCGTENTIGNVNVGIDSTKEDAIVAICGTGKLETTGIYHGIFGAGTLKIEDGDVTASATSKEYTTIEAASIEISGGSVATSADRWMENRMESAIPAEMP